jgi:hypothetical protein
VEVKELVKALRLAVGVSQETVARTSGGILTREEVVKVESGKNQATAYRIREGFANAYGVSIQAMAAYLDGQMSRDELMAHRALRAVNAAGANHAVVPSPRLSDRGEEWENAVKDATELAPYIPPEFFARAGRFIDDPSVPRPIDGQFVADLALGVYKLALRLQKQEQVGPPTSTPETPKKRSK